MIHDPIWMDHFIAARAGMDADMARRVPWARTQVYCITEGRGQPVKIGHSIVFHVRFPNLQCSSPRQLEVCWVAVGCVEHESALKMILWDRRLWGEWFEDPTDEIKTLVPLDASHEQLHAAISGLAERLGKPPNRRRPARPEPPPWKIFDRTASGS